MRPAGMAKRMLIGYWLYWPGSSLAGLVLWGVLMPVFRAVWIAEAAASLAVWAADCAALAAVSFAVCAAAYIIGTLLSLRKSQERFELIDLN